MASFRFDGRRIPLQDGDTIASALHRADVLEVSRSLKYHRARGLYCNAGSCASCFVAVDGVPNVPACMTPAAGGQDVESQNRLGSAKRDLFAITDKVYRKGFDPHGAFTRPRLLNTAFLKAVRFMSGVGKVPEEAFAAEVPQAFREVCDELIVGAGKAGIARAHAAAKAGRRIILVDEADTLGGSSRWDPDEVDVLQQAQAIPDLPGVEAWTDSVVFGLYEDGAGIRRGEDLVVVDAKRVTVCSGHHDGVPLFSNNDMPGIMTLRAAQRLVHGHGVMPGNRIVSDRALPEALLAAMPDVDVTIGTVSEVAGGTRVEKARVDDGWVRCDAVIVHPPRSPRMELLQQAGCTLTIQDGVLHAKHSKTGKTDVTGVYVGIP